MEKIKWGILGLGGIANKFARTIAEMEEVELTAAASRNQGKAWLFGKEYGVAAEKCYGSYEELLADKSIDAVYIAVPHVFHKDLAIACLESGKAVLCEKPVALSGEETREIIASASKNRKFFMEAMKTRFLPIQQRVKQWIDAGKIGEVRLLQADFGFVGEKNPQNRLYDKALGGGALLDVGIYMVSFSSFIFGKQPESIGSAAFIGKTGVDESFSASLCYEGGGQAQLYGAIDLATRKEANIIGTKGRICIPHFSSAQKAYCLVGENEEELDLPFAINGFEYQIEEVNRCIKAGRLQSDIMSWQDSVEVMDIMDCIKRSWDKNHG